MSTMNNTDNKTTDVVATEMRDSTREGILNALVEYYSGRSPSYTDAFAKTPRIAKDTYYKYKRAQPETIAEIDKEAQQLASAGRDEIAIATDSQMLLKSYTVQHEAADYLIGLLPVLDSIARREPYSVVIGKNKDGSDKIKVMLPYGRDAIAATGIMHDIARHGVLPEQAVRMMTVIQPAEVPEPPEAEPLLPLLGIGSDFTKVTAVRPDGTEFTATVKQPDVVMEAEVEIDDNFD